MNKRFPWLPTWKEIRTPTFLFAPPLILLAYLIGWQAALIGYSIGAVIVVGTFYLVDLDLKD